MRACFQLTSSLFSCFFLKYCAQTPDAVHVVALSIFSMNSWSYFFCIRALLTGADDGALGWAGTMSPFLLRDAVVNLCQIFSVVNR